MDDPLDNDLRKRIREVFDNYEDTSADKGWLLLREKFPEKAKKRPIVWLWWSGVAAAVLLFLGIGFWLTNKPVTNTGAIVKIKKILTDTALYAKDSQHITDNNKATDTPALQKQGQVLATTGKQNSMGNNGNIKPTISPKTQASMDVPPVINNSPNQALAVVVSPGNNTNKPIIITKADSAKNAPVVKNSASALSLTDATKINPMPFDTASAITKLANKATTKPVAKSPMEMFANDNNLAENRKTEKIKNKDPLFRFSIYEATYVNYAKGSNNQVNVGAGFTTDIRITHHLKFSTGVSVGQNTLNYGSQSTIPVATSSAMAIAANANLQASSYKSEGFFLESSPALKSYNANLVGLDIPLNFKYLFSPDKNDSYVLAGLSSGTFINETYGYSYHSPTGTDVTQGVSTKNNFNGFYFAKTVNFAFGVGYPLGKNKIIIEPFVKYPIDGMGSQQLKFGAGGLNLKFNFTTQKK